MNLAPIDFVIIAAYMLIVVLIGVWVSRRATRGLSSFFLADRSLPWWVLGLAGCSSYIDIGGTMAMVGLMYYLGLQAVWATHIFWGWFIICFYMAFQARWIRRSGVMTFAEWNETRFGQDRRAEAARIAAALFLLLLMIFNLMFIAVGVGKFAEALLEVPRWQGTLAVFVCVGIYTTLGGFFGVVLTDVLQTVLIALMAFLLAWFAVAAGDPAPLFAAKPEAWNSLAPAWSLWEGFAQEAPGVYADFELFGPLLLASFAWLLFRVLAGPNVWDFQFFLTAKSPRDAQLAAGMWTVGYTLRWIIACAFLVLGLEHLAPAAQVDGETIMPVVLLTFRAGTRGLFVALLLAALMSTLDAMINVTSSVVVNDFLKRYVKRLSERALVRLGQVASAAALVLAFWFSMRFDQIADIWQVMILVVVTLILVPATLRWHWWRFGPLAFVLGMVGTLAVTVLGLVFFRDWPERVALPLRIGCSLLICLAAGFFTRPAPRDVLVRFYASIRPFGFWGPIRRAAIEQGLVPRDDKTPAVDLLNGFLTALLQVLFCLLPFLFFLGRRGDAAWVALALCPLGVLLYFTWYRTLPPRDEA
ncbi:MAG: hypothetical protein HY812_09530 [Planctomycetes bacterium]|nr:hypothetical protein [Planctomycetota bacterium]